MRIRQVVAAFLLLKQGIEQAVEDVGGICELEERVGSVVRDCTAQILEGTLESLDDGLLTTKPEELAVEGFRSRAMVSTYGELKIRRRLYKDKSTGERRFLLDEALGLEPRVRVTPKFRELAVELSVEMPFRRAAEILGKTMPHVSAMTVWNATKEAGEKAKADGKGLRERVYEHGEDPGGTRKVDSLNIEADGMLVGVQRSKKRRAEVKLGVAYEGKKTKGDRVGLVERRVVAGVIKDRGFWEEVTAALGSHWDLSAVKDVVIGADGAGWGKAGVEYFDNATYQLDRFHLRKAMREALGHSPEDYSAVSESLRSKDRNTVIKALTEAGKKVTGKKRQGIINFEMYVLGNWEGIKGDFTSLGTIEGQVYHHLARRMKRLGARWTTDGADRMARLCGAKANGELGKYSATSVDHSSETTRKSLTKPRERVGNLDKKAAEVGEWLRARVPSLEGPHQSRPFVKHVLRQLVTAGGISL